MQATTAKEYQAIPGELIDRKQWVLWKLENVIDTATGKPKLDKNGKLEQTKVPYQINGKKAGSTIPATWTSYNAALQSSNGYSGLGYVLTDADPYTVIDLDDCIINGKMTDDAKLLMDSFDSYTEYSQSGNGLHIFVKAKKPGKRSKNPEKNIELYDGSRFIVMTGNHVKGTPDVISDRQGVLDYVYDMYFPTEEKKHSVVKTDKELSLQLSDDEVLRIAFRAKNGAEVKVLYEGSFTEKYSSQSEADQALCNYIAFYTQDYEQIDRIFINSGLYRDKWDREDYKSETIQNAVAGLNATYQKFELHLVESDDDNIRKGNWWKLNENGTTSLLHDRFANYVLQENNIVRFPDRHGDLYIYNESKGIYEVDKTSRHLRSIIRGLEFLKNNQVKEVQDYIADMSPVVKEESTEYVAVNNGLLHLETMVFTGFTPDVFVTKKVPTNYNTNAYDKFVAETLHKVSRGYQPTIKNIHEMFGAVLYPTLLVPKMFYLYGRSAHNGKSTVLYMIQKTFNSGGSISAVSPHRLAENSFAGSSIYGKMANIVDDQPDKVIEDSGSLKTIITGGYIEIEYKGKDSRTVQMNTVCITASNHYPNFKEYGRQINKRLYIIPFDHNFSEDPAAISERESMAKLETENAREYVLKLAVEAIKEMTQRTGNILTTNEKVEEASKEFSELNDPLTDYFDEFNGAYFEEHVGTRTYEDYLDWCSMQNIRHTFGMKRFKEAVCARYNMVWKDKRVMLNGRSRSAKGFVAKK